MASKTWIVWGRHPEWASGRWIKLTGGTLPYCRREREWRLREGFEISIRAAGSPSPAKDMPVNMPADPDVEPQPYDMPSPEADALDRIAGIVTDDDLWGADERYEAILAILREAGRLP